MSLFNLSAPVFQSEKPFPHVIVDGCFDSDLVREASRTWPAPGWEGWHAVYDTPLERKRACNMWNEFPAPIALLMGQLLALPAGALLRPREASRSYKNPDWGALTPDGTLRGGGMHDCGRGDHLDLHEDSDHHPKFKWGRRVNAILFLNEAWEPDWEGYLEFWHSDYEAIGVDRPAARIAPAFNRLVVFEVGDGHIHGVPEPLRCPPDVRRKSLAAFWFTPRRPDEVFKRPRALFVGRPGERDPEKEAMRARRARLHE